MDNIHQTQRIEASNDIKKPWLPYKIEFTIPDLKAVIKQRGLNQVIEDAQALLKERITYINENHD